MLWWLAAAFVLVHIFIYCLGVRFDDQLLYKGWQHLDVELLRHNLLESLFYLHSQPPLFNLFLGIVLKLFYPHPALVFQASYLICGLIIYLSLFWVQVRLGVGKWLAFSLSTLFILSPSSITYGYHLYYTFPVAAILMASALLLHEFVVKQKSWQALCLFSLLFLLSGIRALFHLVYFVTIAATLIVLLRPIRRKIVLAAVLPFVLILSLYCMNLMVFGDFSTSSWLGMNVLNVVTTNVSMEDRRLMVADGKLSELALIERFLPLAEYPSRYQDVKRYRDIPALTVATKSTGAPNYNHLAYLTLSEQYLEDFLQLLKERPLAYLKGVQQACLIYLVPNVMFVPFNEDRDKTAFLESFYDTYFYGKFDRLSAILAGLWPFSLIPGYPLHLFLFIGLPLLLVHGLVLSLRNRGHSIRLDRDRRIVVLYMCLSIIYVAVVGNMLELGENSRFRFTTDPFYVVLLGLFIQFSVKGRLLRFLHRLRSSSASHFERAKQ